MKLANEETRAAVMSTCCGPETRSLSGDCGPGSIRELRLVVGIKRIGSRDEVDVTTVPAFKSKKSSELLITDGAKVGLVTVVVVVKGKAVVETTVFFLAFLFTTIT